MEAEDAYKFIENVCKERCMTDTIDRDMHLQKLITDARSIVNNTELTREVYYRMYQLFDAMEEYIDRARIDEEIDSYPTQLQEASWYVGLIGLAVVLIVIMGLAFMSGAVIF